MLSRPPGLTAPPNAGLADVVALFAPYSNSEVILLAASGGPDSMALAHLARAWAKGSPRPTRLVAATVDHGLREASSAEAAQVADWCNALGIAHHTLVWQGVKPKTRLQETARAARYALLHDLAVQLGATFILTAHHADDQAETVLQRLARGSGVSGLGGMAEQTALAPAGVHPVILARPLLSLRKQVLVDICTAVGQPFFDDPSNVDPRFARARWRQMAEALAAEGLDAPALVRLAARARRADAALISALQELSAGIATDGHVRKLAQAPDELVIRWLQQVVTAAAGRVPRYDRTETLALRLKAAVGEGRAFRASLGGCVLSVTARGVMNLTADVRQRGRTSASPSQTEDGIE